MYRLTHVKVDDPLFLYDTRWHLERKWWIFGWWTVDLFGREEDALKYLRNKGITWYRRY